MARNATSREAALLTTYRLRTNGKYPWKLWQDGNAWIVRRGEDFHTIASGFQTQLYARARAEGMRIRTQLLDDDTILFRFERKDDA
mgnify:CR=1 FL=1